MAAYIKRLRYLDVSASYADNAALRAPLLWIFHARPDVSDLASIIGSNREANLCDHVVVEVTGKLAHLKETVDVSLSFP